MPSTETGETSSLPWGVSTLEALTRTDADGRAEETADLAALARAGVSLARALIVELSGGDAEPRLQDAVRRALDRSAAVHLRPLFPTRSLAHRFGGRPGMRTEIRSAAEVAPRVRAFLDAVSTSEITASLGGGLSRLRVVVAASDGEAAGRAASADPVHGDPDEIRVWESAATPWLVDRKTARVTDHGEGRLDAHAAGAVADLADRAQLALGRPVEIEWLTSGGKLSVSAVRSLAFAPAFTTAPFRMVALITSDDGVVAPLAVDALDAALRSEATLADDACVRRIYARPYRRMDAPAGLRASPDPVSIARAYARMARAAVEVAAPVALASRFEQQLGARLSALAGVDLTRLDDDALLEELRDRERLVVEALRLLDRERLATIAVLGALEAAVGTLPRECYPALARPRATRARRKAHEKLAKLSRQIVDTHGRLVGPNELAQPLREQWDALAKSLCDTRPLGIDVRPRPYAASEDLFLAALAESFAEQDEAAERARRHALRRLAATARERTFGRSREGIARALGVMLSRVASAKGRVAEGLAASMLVLRDAAIEAGRRLERRGSIDEPEDALYLSFSEIEEALAGEPGAYAARVRLRREDDARWARYEAPRRIDARRRTGA